MTIIVYSFPSAGDAALAGLVDAGGRSVARALLSRLAGLAGGTRLLVGDDPGAPALARDAGWPLVPLDRREIGFEEECLWSLDRLGAALAARGLVDPGRPLALIDLRNAFLGAASLERALAAVSGAGAEVLLSLKPSRDNPIQLEAAYTLLDSGHIALFDPTPGLAEAAGRDLAAQGGEEAIAGGLAAGLGLTWPAPLDWRFFKLFAPAPGEAYALVRWPWLKPSRRLVMVRAEAAGGLARLGIPVLGCLRCEGERLGRRLVAVGERAGGARLAGVPLVLPPDRWTAAVLHVPGGLGLYCDRRITGPDVRVRVWPVGPDGIDRDASLEVVPGAGADLETVELAGRPFHGPYLTVGGGPARRGLHYALLRRVGQGQADYVESLSIESGLFSIDPATRTKILTATGEQVWGRQRFPPYHVPDFALVVLAPGVVGRLRQSLAAGRVAWLGLPGAEGIKLRSAIDLQEAGIVRSLARPDPAIPEDTP